MTTGGAAQGIADTTAGGTQTGTAATSTTRITIEQCVS